MVGTIQANRMMGCNIKTEIIEMNKPANLQQYNSHAWEHNKLPLCGALWSGDAVAKTLSIFHSAFIYY